MPNGIVNLGYYIGGLFDGNMWFIFLIMV
jgi:hypothetical protein